MDTSWFDDEIMIFPWVDDPVDPMVEDDMEDDETEDDDDDEGVDAVS